mmetsp:Transcript_9362/g.21787  ORF Transcript_9362/g.21787 Transcript_9362/m.21787 type:complete len:338 (+) Transcript_9362:260-1273(+)
MECDDVGGHMRGLMIEYAPANRSLELLRPLTEQKIVIPGSTADMMQQQKAREKQRLELSYTIALLAGGCAGTAVDVTLFPIDTIKTRMQAPCGFRAAGGFGSVYRGLLGAACGSAPGAALFFSTYERVKDALMEGADEEYHPLCYMAASSCGEVVACWIRVPTENVKQKMQAGIYPTTRAALNGIVGSKGWRGFYVGYGSTIMREIPFSFIQFPIYETLKKRGAQHRGRALQPFESALCGSVGGGVSAAITTPFDVIKTHLMIGRDRQGVPYTGWRSAVLRIYQSGGAKMFFRGIVPRTVWIALGGCVFFGSYETAKLLLVEQLLPDDDQPEAPALG